MRNRRRSVIGVIALLALVMLSWSASAQAARVRPYLSEITGRGPTTPFSEEACGVTVDEATGEVLAQDPGDALEEGPKEREFEYAVDVFGPTGSLITSIESKAHPLEGACSSAINEAPESADSGYVYVGGELNGQEVVQIFAPSVGKKGEQTYKAAGKITGADTPAGEFVEPIKVAVENDTGDVYVADSEQGVVDEFDAEGDYLKQLVIPSAEEGEEEAYEGGLAIDQSTDDLYVASNTTLEFGYGASGKSEEQWVIDEFDPAGTLAATYTGPPASGFGELSGLAVAPNGNLLASDSRDQVVDELNPVGEFLGAIDGSGTPCGALVDPTGVAVNAAGDVYVADRREATGEPSVVCMFGLAPPVPSIESESTSKVKASTATLEAQIDPAGVDTRFYFQVGNADCSATPASCASIAGADIGSSERIQHVSVPASGLQANATYHYRVVASYAGGEVAGPDQTFTTQSEGSGLALIDGRSWQMVSPVKKGAAAVEPLRKEGGLLESSEDGRKITYPVTAPLGDVVEGSRSPEIAQILASRGAGGWTERDLATTNSAANGALDGGSPEYRFFTPDLSLAVLVPFGAGPDEPLLTPDASEKTPYERHNESCDGTAEECFRPLVTGAGELADVVPGTSFGGGLPPGVDFATATPSGEHVALTSKVPLTSEPAAPANDLYEWDGANPPSAQLQLVNVLPDGTPAAQNEMHGAATLGADGHGLRHALSDDGSRVVWGFASHLYVRDMPRHETIQLDAAQGVAEPAEGDAVFQLATPDGSKVFFTDGQQLTSQPTAASPGSPDVYEFEVTSAAGQPLHGTLTDLTADATEPADVVGAVLGGGEDGQSLYFVANGALSDVPNDNRETASPRGRCAGESAPFGSRCNLYAEHYSAAEGKWSAPTFIASLSGTDDYFDWYDTSSSGTDGLALVTSRVSPNGRYLAFMSDRHLSEYDNSDLSSGAPDEEVYRYDGATNRLVCASCNPSGSRPAGVFDNPGDSAEGVGLVVDRPALWQGKWLAGNIPGWTREGTGADAIYQSRYLSNAGRLYFNSPDALVAHDTNGKEDVYEYEPAGTPHGQHACTTASESPGFVYSASSEGCVGLISSGESNSESAFVDASERGGEEAGGGDGREGGGDVFFVTAGKLAPQDIDTDLDLYDAQECTSESPCAPSSTNAPAGCSTIESSTVEACRGGASTGAGESGAPPSASTTAPGNLVPQTAVLGTHKVVLSRAQKLAKALKACRKLKKKKKRDACEAHARKQYGPKKATKHKKKRKKRKSTKGKG